MDRRREEKRKFLMYSEKRGTKWMAKRYGMKRQSIKNRITEFKKLR